MQLEMLVLTLFYRGACLTASFTSADVHALWLENWTRNWGVRGNNHGLGSNLVLTPSPAPRPPFPPAMPFT